MASHPLQRLQRPARTFLWLLAATVVITLLFLVIGPNDPGIAAFELAGTAARSGEILTSWDAGEQLRASFGLGFDYLYMPVYATTIALACVWAASRLRAGGGRAFVLVVAWLAWAAVLFDATENVALFQQLLSGPDDTAARIAQYCATMKFALIVLGVVVSIGAFIASRGRTRSDAELPASTG